MGIRTGFRSNETSLANLWRRSRCESSHLAPPFLLCMIPVARPRWIRGGRKEHSVRLISQYRLTTMHTQYSFPLLAFHTGSSPTSSRRPSFPTGVMGMSAWSAVREGTKMGSSLSRWRHVSLAERQDDRSTWYLPSVWLGLAFGPLDLERDPVIL